MTVANSGLVMIVDDEAEVRLALRDLLELEQLAPVEFASAEQALLHIGADFPGVVVTDLRMPGIDGEGLFNRLARLDPELPVILISGHGDIATALDLVRRGAYDFLAKPFDAERLIATVRRALDKRALALENRALRQSKPASEPGALLGESREIEQLRLTIHQLVQADIDVMITGESGTGKSLVADILHRRSPRVRKPMVTLDCRALPETQAESLLFGHVSGAFPGAQFPRTGQLQHAHTGTLFLDHVDGLPAALQRRVQQALEEGSAIPVGGIQPQAAQFRCLSATSTDLDARSRDGSFLASLYFKLGAFRIALPPLRDRRDDTVFLFRGFLIEEARRLNRDPPALTAAVWRRLRDYDWPGNVRELRGFAASVALGLTSSGSALPGTEVRSDGDTLKDAVAQFERAAICMALERNRGDIAATTTELGLPRKTLYDKLTRFGVDPADYRPVRR